MLNKGKNHTGVRAFLLTIPLFLSWLSPVITVEFAGAAPGILITSEVVSLEPVRSVALDSPTVQAGDDAGPYGNGRATLNVTSTPAGAELFLADRPLGVTPWSGSDLPGGRFVLRLHLPNHQLLEDQVELAAGLAVNKSYALLPAQGSLVVQTFPYGAKVFLDGHEQKGRTPLEINEIQTGPHLVRVHLDRFYDAEEKVIVAANGVSRVRFDLKGGALELCGEKWLESEAASRCRAEAAERQQATLVGEFVKVPGGCFQMGDALGGGWSDEKPVHEVCLASFAIGRYEVTQRQWLAVMGKNPAYFKRGDNFPVEQITWPEAQNFIVRVNELTGKKFRLPSEAEWEYAARGGGKKELYAGGNNLEDLGWYDHNSRSSTHPVGAKQPNGLGIYDMSGNVGEWVQDWYDGDYYKLSPRHNPVGPLGGCYGRVIRGGGWNIDAGLARAANRDRYEPTNRFAAIGFRLAYSVK